jgi:hypothetical protein
MRGLLVSIVSLFLASCSMVGSTALGELGQRGCDSQAGYYFLPKTELLIEVERAKDGNNVFHQIKLHSKRVSDKRFGYCLDYLTNAAADDIVQVRKHPTTAILGLVTTDALDQSSYILKTIVRTIFVGISGDPTFRSRAFLETGGDKAVVFKGQLDPFDPVHSAIVNDALKAFGYCIVLHGGFMFDPALATPESYCDDPKGTLRSQKIKRLQYHKAGAASQDTAGNGRGIYYRPRVPHQVQLYMKSNPLLPGGWKLRLARAVEMENVAPIIQVGIDRAAFTQKKTSLIFDEGMLKNVCIYKKSELQEFVSIPLYVAQSVVALPAQIARVRINQTNNQREIIEAEEELIKTQLHHLKVLRGEADPGSPGNAAHDPNTAVGDENTQPPTRKPLPEATAKAFEICPESDPLAVASNPVFPASTQD